MTQKDMVAFLKKESLTNDCLRSVLVVFCTRVRPRRTLTVKGLSYKMSNEGFSYSQKEYESVIGALAYAGFGQPDLVGTKVVGLRDIKMTFQSLGDVVYNNGSKLRDFKSRNKFNKVSDFLSTESEEIVLNRTDYTEFVEVGKPKPSTGLRIESKSFEMSLELMINGKPVRVQVPNNLTSDEVSELVTRLKTGS
jgi:hypothetical protein